MLCNLSSLRQEQIEAIRSLEKSIGKTLLAYSCREADMAKVSEDQLKQIKDLESRLGVALVAVST